MLRDTNALLLALVVIGIAASPASAIAVERPGGNELSANNIISLGVHVTGVGYMSQQHCDNHWTGAAGAEGHVTLDEISIDPTAGSVGNCEEMDDCDDAGWEGQVGEAGTGFSLNQHMCLEGLAGALDGVAFEVDCPIFNTEAHCDAPLRYEGTSVAVTSSGFQVELVGEISISNSLGLTH
jgi:hypothetical protein